METILAINIPPELEEELVDYLLRLKCVSGFTSYAVHGHGQHKAMSLAEQVSGRTKRLQIEIILQQSDVDTVLSGLAENVGRDIVYWQQVITNHGKIE